MPILSRRILFVVLLTAAAGALGGWLGVRYGIESSHQRSGLDDLVHRSLVLTDSQHRAITEIEAHYAGRRKTLEGEMRAANRDLAAAIRSELEYGPRSKAAISRFHAAESDLQQETVQHILAMRRLLNPDQARKFEQEVSSALMAE